MRRERKSSFCQVENVLADGLAEILNMPQRKPHSFAAEWNSGKTCSPSSRGEVNGAAFRMTIEAVLVLLAASFFAGTARAEVCIADEDCNNLGYTEDKACTDGLKCPFGEKWHCPDKKCQIGWILNSDMSCTENVESGKTPIAVVVYLDGNGNGQAMTASPTAQSIAWSTEEKATGVPQFPNYKDAWNDFGSCSNTVKAMTNGDSQKYPAPWSAKTYAPSAAALTKGQWCLPAAGVLYSLYTNLDVINNTISKLGGKQLINNKDSIWSSTEYAKDSVWAFFKGVSEQGGLNALFKNSYQHVRPVIEFNTDGAVACKPLTDETGCTYGKENADNTCGGTRKVCVEKPECDTNIYKYTCDGPGESTSADVCDGKYSFCFCEKSKMWEDGQCVPAGYIEEYISDYSCTEEADKYVGGGRVPKIRCTLCPEKHKGEYGKMRVWFFKDGTKEEMRQACEEAAAKFTPYWYQAEGTKCAQSFCS